jgi:hypothetical protein
MGSTHCCGSSRTRTAARRGRSSISATRATM